MTRKGITYRHYSDSKHMYERKKDMGYICIYATKKVSAHKSIKHKTLRKRPCITVLHLSHMESKKQISYHCNLKTLWRFFVE